VDEGQARLILGLEAGELTPSIIRDARNAALKGHHPDLAGTDAAAVRRATHWAGQINLAFETLMAAHRPATQTGASSEPNDGDRSKQSFAAAASRAEARLNDERRADEERAAREQAQADARSAATSRAQARESDQSSGDGPAKVQGDAPAAGSTAPAADPTPTPARDRLAGFSTPRLLAGGLVAAVVGVSIGLWAPSHLGATSALDLSAAGSALPSASSEPIPRATPAATPSSAPVGGGGVPRFFAWMVSLERSKLDGCFTTRPCGVDDKMEYADGSSPVISAEIPRLAALLRDDAFVRFDDDAMCREEYGSVFRLLAVMGAEIAVVERLRPGEVLTDGWRPAGYHDMIACRSTDPLAPDHVSASDLVHRATLELTNLQSDLKHRDWSTAGVTGKRLAQAGCDLALVAARDYPSQTEWQALRGTAMDLCRIGATATVTRLAATSDFRSLVDTTLATLRKVDL